MEFVVCPLATYQLAVVRKDFSMPAAGRRLSTDRACWRTEADRAQDSTDDSVRVERGQPAFTEDAQHVEHNPHYNLEFQLRGRRFRR